MEISKITWRAALSGAAFGKSSAVYGQIDENGRLFVNLNEILAESAEQYCCLKKVVFIHLGVGYARRFDRIEIKRMFHVKHPFFRLF